MNQIHGEKSSLIAANLAPKRRRAGLVYTEGERVVAMALAGTWNPRTLFVREDSMDKPEMANAIRMARSRNCPVELVTGKALSRLSDCETAPPIGLVLEPVIPNITDLVKLPTRLLVLDRIKDPGNAGTLVRSAIAFGFCTVFVEGTVSPSNEKLTRASAGICFLQGSVFNGGPVGTVSTYLASNGYDVYTLEPAASKSLSDRRSSGRVALVMGSEVAGVDAFAWNSAVPVRIPMSHEVESLNVAMAGSIAMYEFSRPSVS